MEEQFILRVPPSVAERIERLLNESPSDDKSLDLSFSDNGRRGTFTIGDDQFPASLFDLPCIVESHKTYDDSVLIKTADVGQMIMVRIEGDPAPEVVEYRHGLTPPMRDARRRRFRREPDFKCTNLINLNLLQLKFNLELSGTCSKSTVPIVEDIRINKASDDVQVYTAFNIKIPLSHTSRTLHTNFHGNRTTKMTYTEFLAPRKHVDFPEGKVAPEPRLEKEVVAIGSSMNKRRRKRGNAEAEATAPPKVLRKDYASIYPGQSTRRGKSLTAMEFEVGIPAVAPTTQETPTGAKGVIDPDPLSYAKPRPALERDVTRVQEGARRRGSRVEEVNLLYIYGSVTKEYLSAWVGSQQLSPGYSGCVSGRGGSHSTTGVAMGSQLRLRSVKVEVQGLRDQSKNLGTLLEAEVDMRNAAEAKNTELAKELDSLRAKFSNLQVNSNQLSQQVTTLQVQVTCEEIIKAAFEEFKRYEDDRVKKRCVEMDTRLDALSVDFDEELYPHMQTAVAGRRWVIGHGLCLAIMKCAESMELRHAFADVVSDGLVKAIEAYDPEADTKFTTALQALKDLKYPLVDQLEQLKDAPIDLIMASLHLESDTGEDAPSFICDLRPSSSQLKIHVYPEDAAAQTESLEDRSSPRLVRSKSLPVMYNLDWP
ncbi:gypsy type transposase [Tanacetum coccineum]